MKVLVSGTSGLLGQSLVRALEQEGNRVVRLVRSGQPSAKDPKNVVWDPVKKKINGNVNELDAVVHLMGEPIVDGAWTPDKKKRIFNSRVQSTRLLAQTLAVQKKPPKVFVSASAVGIYGNRGDTLLTEKSNTGTGFLSLLSRAWEQATGSMARKQVRTVQARLGLILSPQGGILKQLLPLFKNGAGASIGSGQQYMSWISERDAVRGLLHILKSKTLEGPVNLTAPNPVTNQEFSQALHSRLNPCPLLPLIPAPKWAVEWGLGKEKTQELLLNSQRAIPQKLEEDGFKFQDATLPKALDAILGPGPKSQKIPTARR